MPNVDIIQLKTICYDTEIGFCLCQLLILGQSLQAHMFHPSTTDHTITYRAQYWKNQLLLFLLHI